jgi:hypothetical protein
MAHHFADGLFRILVIGRDHPPSRVDFDLGLRILEVALEY